MIMSKTYYVSAVGSDQNDGLSPERPLQSFDALATVGDPGDQVLFRRGDIWRLPTVFECRSGVTYDAYGEGDKPRFYGSLRNYAQAELWEPAGEDDLWRCALDFEGDVCHVVFDDGAAWGVRRRTLAEVTEELDYYYDGEAKAVFLRCVGHPAQRFSSVELVRGALFRIPFDGRDITIRNLDCRYCNYAICSYCDRVGDVRGLNIEHCDFSWIGGHEGNYAPGGVRDGNAITIWGSARQVVVDHCDFYQLFDTAFTLQCGASPNSDVVFEDITMSNCRIEGCHWSTEFWIHVKDDNDGQLGTMRNIRIENNHFIGAGEGWAACQRWNGGPPSSASHIQVFSGEECAVIENFLVRNNIFESASHDLISFHWKNAVPILEGNTFIQVKGRPLGHINGKRYMFDDTVEEMIRQFDKTATVRFIDAQAATVFDGEADEKAHCHVH